MSGVEPLQGSLLGATEPRLASEPVFERLVLDERSWVDIARGWLLGADTLLEQLVDEVPWRQYRRIMYGQIVDEPRVSKWYRLDEPVPHKVIRQVRTALQSRYHLLIASVGLNYYRNGRDSVAWHRDTELRNLDPTLVAMVTLGAARASRCRTAGRRARARPNAAPGAAAPPAPPPPGSAEARLEGGDGVEVLDGRGGAAHPALADLLRLPE
jgi:alkylated DNA repair dioxygenase AlkB